MTDLLVLELVKKNLVTNKLSLNIGYDVDNLKNKDFKYDGEIIKDRYGRNIPKYSEGIINLEDYTSSSKIIIDKMLSLYDKIIKSKLLIRRVTIVFDNIIPFTNNIKKHNKQLNLFSDYQDLEKQEKEIEIDEKKERNMQKAIINIQEKYGKNALLKGMNYQKGAKTIERNETVGGHRG